ncbi:MAG TPA: glycosyltransferase family 2 protein [Gaiellaceae bacterium]|nr:glycosyltransferase family 2 protein [Gaiellaceae bacterium]
MLPAKILFWLSFGGIVWTHLGYPIAAALLARVLRRGVARGAYEPSVTVIVPAHDEEEVIGARIENLLALDYPKERLEVLVVSDGSTDGTDEIVRAQGAREPRVRLLALPRGGKLAALNTAVGHSDREVVAFSDANSRWAPDTLRTLVRALADEDVAYVCGKLVLARPDGTNREGAYWRYELWLRESESALGSITGGNGAVYAVRRADYVPNPWGQDLGLPVESVKRHKRAVYDPDAVAYEKPAASLEDEYGRKVRMFRWAWQHLLRGSLLRGVGPLYGFQLFSHRVLRYASGLLHLVWLGSSLVLIGEGWIYGAALAAQLAWLALAALGRLRVPIPGAGLAYYYLLVTWATVAALAGYLRHGVSPHWERTEGAR